MSVGAGIAIAGIWGFAAACALSKNVTGVGLVMAMVFGLMATLAVTTMGH